jgi:transcriptional regulator with XRE-family HTH domain
MDDRSNQTTVFMSNETLGRYLQQLRENLCMTRREVASRYGTSTRLIAALETAKSRTSRKERRTFKGVYIEFLGYVRRIRRNDYVHRDFNLRGAQERLLEFYNAGRL